MPDNTRSSNSILAFIVGGLVVAVGVLVYVLYGGKAPGNDAEITIEFPKINIQPGN